MAVIKCKMCGGNLVLVEGQSVAECEYCGSRQTVPTADNEKKMTLFSRANRLRAACEFDKAAGIYEAIVTDFPEEAEAYWGLVLCKYGIEYVDDPATGKKIPTCHRSSFDSVMDDSNFEQAMENADEVALRVYRQEAKQIEGIRKGILEVSSSEKPYDIFICYKETDSNGDRTVDSLLAQDIYDDLTSKGYRVFFSRITLEDKLGQAYEPYIFAALNSARIMLAVGTCYEHYNAVWVKNEWSRYLKIIAQDKNKYLIPCYKGLDAYDIPKEFAHLQGQDMGKVGAISDLLRGIEKLMPRYSSPAVKSALTSQSRTTANSSSDSLVFRGMLALEDREWNKADQFFEQALDLNPQNGNAYLGKLLVDLRLQRKSQLPEGENAFHQNRNYLRILQFADAPLVDELKRYQKLFDTKNQQKVELAIETIHTYVQDAHAKEKLASCRIAVQQIEEKVLQAEQKIKKYAELMSGNDHTDDKIIASENKCIQFRISVDEKQAECKTLEKKILHMQNREMEILASINKLGWFDGKKKKEYKRQLEEISFSDIEKALKISTKEMNHYSTLLSTEESILKELKQVALRYQKWNADMEAEQKILKEAKSARKEALEAERLAKEEMSGHNIRIQDIMESYMFLCQEGKIPEFDDELRSYLPSHIQISGEKIDSDHLSAIKAYCSETGGFVNVRPSNDIVCVYPENTFNTVAFFNTIYAIINGDVEKDKEYYLKVIRLLPIGAFMNSPRGNASEFIHISKLASHRVERVEDVVGVGDCIRVKYTGLDEKGRANWSHKDIVSG